MNECGRMSTRKSGELEERVAARTPGCCAWNDCGGKSESAQMLGFVVREGFTLWSLRALTKKRGKESTIIEKGKPEQMPLLVE